MLVACRRHGPLAELRLNWPEALNASNLAMKRELVAALAELRRDDALRALVLAGAGRAFCTGGDIKEKPLLDEAAQSEALRLQQAICAALASLPVPTIAAVHGHALGGGLEMAASCDIRIAGPAARFGAPVGRSASLSTGGLHHRLPRLVGAGWTAEILLAGTTIDAETALRIGLVTRLADDPVEAARNLAASLVEQAPDSVQHGKRLLRLADHMDVGSVMDAELAALAAF